MPSKKTDQMIFVDGGIELKVGKDTFVIQPFTIGTRSAFTKLITSVLKNTQFDISQVEKGKIGNGEIIASIIDGATDNLVDFYKVILNKDEEYINKILFADELLILEAVLEVNDIDFLLKTVQRIFSKMTKK